MSWTRRGAAALLAVGFALASGAQEPAALFFNHPTPLTVFNGVEGLLVGSNGCRIAGAAEAGQLGSDVDGAGDFDGDGRPDMLLAAPLFGIGGNFRAGRVYLVWGTNSFLPEQAVNLLGAGVLDGAAAEDRAGSAVAGGGDFNDDGLADFAAGAPNADEGTRTNCGAVALVFGTTNRFTSLSFSALNGSNGILLTAQSTGALAGSSVAWTGDWNGDGRAELAVGAPAAYGNGRVYVLYGNPAAPHPIALDALNGTNGFILTGAVGGGGAGTTVANIGDFDGDGLDDLAIGAPAEPDIFSAGRVYVVFGGADRPALLSLASLDGTNGFRLDGSGFFSGIGQAIAGADVNGDGRSDLLVGARGLSSVFVLYGSSNRLPVRSTTALNGTNGFVLISPVAGGDFGACVARAGRMNADAFEDFLVGALNEPPSGLPGAGRLYAVMGAPSFASTTSVALLNGTNGFYFAGQQGDAEFGNAAASLGDLNDDGCDEIIAGEWLLDAGSPALTNAGAAYLVSPAGIAGYVLHRPVFSTTLLTNGAPELVWTAQPGAEYTVLGAESPLGPWQNMVTTTGGVWSATGLPTRAVYRVDARRL